MAQVPFFDDGGYGDPSPSPSANGAVRRRRVRGRQRLGAAHEEILGLLRQGPVSTWRLVKQQHRFSARVKELREAGYEIETRFDRSDGGGAVYVLLREPDGSSVGGDKDERR